MTTSKRWFAGMAAVAVVSALIGALAVSARAQQFTEEEMQMRREMEISSRAEFATATAEQGEAVGGGMRGIDAENYPKVTGSTSTYPLGMLILSRAMGLPGSLGRAVSPTSLVFVSMGGGSDMNISMLFSLRASPVDTNRYSSLLMQRARHIGTNQSYMALIKGESDIILVARKPSPDELQAAREAGVELDARPVALDAFVFLVNRENPLEGLTLDQIRSIYEGKTTRWPEVMGNDVQLFDEPIRAFTREPNSGSQELMIELVMGDRQIIGGGDRMLMGMMGPIDRIAQDKAGIAYSVYYYEKFINPHPNNRTIAIDGVAPNAETLADRSYPLTAEVYVVVRKDAAADSPSVILRDWLLSNEGQKLVAESGYVPIK